MSAEARAASAREHAAEIRALTPTARLRLAGKAGVATAKDDAKLAQALALALASPEGAQRILDGLSPDGRALARLHGTGPGTLSSKELSAWARAELGWTKPRFGAAHAELLACGLHRDPGDRYVEDHVALLACFAEGASSSEEAFSAGLLPEAAPVVPMGRRLALLAAYAFLDPVRRTRAGGLNSHWLERAYGAFAPLGTSSHQLFSEVNVLLRLGVLARRDEGDEADRYHVVPTALASLDARPIELGLAVLECAASDSLEHARGLLVAIDRVRKQGHQGPVPLALVASALHEVDTLALWQLCRAHPEQYGPRPLARGAGLLRRLGLVTVTSGAEGLQVTEVSAAPATGKAGEGAPPAAPHGERPTSRWIVQPNFEVLVPEDAGAAATARLGEIADLQTVDRVARFRLTRESVGRSLVRTGSVSEALDHLRAGALHGVPENVAETISSWGRRASVARPYRGGVIVAGSPEQAEVLRARPDVQGEIAPGVFHVSGPRLAEILKELAAAGHVVAPLAADRHDAGAVRAAQTANACAERLGKQIERVAATLSPELARRQAELARIRAEAAAAAARAKRASKTGEPPPARPSVPPRRKAVDVECVWPLVHRVLEARRDLLATILAVHDDTLWSAEESGSPRAAERFLAEVGEAMGLLPGAPGAPAPPSPSSAPSIPPPPATEGGARAAAGPARGGRTPDPDRAAEAAAAVASCASARGPVHDDEDEEGDGFEDDEVGAGARHVGLDADWKTLPLGQLEDVLGYAAEHELLVEVLYVNAAGQSKPRVIQPTNVHRQKRRVWTDARDPATDSTHTFALDRIAAIRALPA